MSEIYRSHPARHQIQVHPGLKNLKEYTEEESWDILHKVGKIAANIRDTIASEVKPNASVLDLCTHADKMIKEAGVKAAFPINVSINDIAAHYTAPLKDTLLIPEKGVVKVDVGVSLDGWIADTAKSVDITGSYKDLQDASIDALEAAIGFIKPGVKAGEVGRKIEEAIKAKGFAPVRDLQGHLVQRYIVHAGKSIPNFYIENSDTVELGEVYAIEPFASTGKGSVRADTAKINIFRAAPERVPLRTPYARKIMSIAIKEFGGMPFAERWLTDFGMSNAEIKVGMKELREKHGAVEYHVLRAYSKDTLISQHEHTMIIKEDGAEVTTRAI